VQVADYINPPFLLSAEGTDDERTWSLGTYTPADAIFRAFGLRTWFRGQSGVFANQPNPHAEGATRARRYLVRVLLLLVLVFGAHYLVAGRTVAFQQRYQITPAGTLAGTDDDAFVTPAFALEGRASNVQLELDTDLDNSWLYFTLALINEATGDTRSVGREVSYYHGSSGSESWWEGSRDEAAVIGQVPAGRYLLRVGVEGDSAQTGAARPPSPSRCAATCPGGSPTSSPWWRCCSRGSLPRCAPPALKGAAGPRATTPRWPATMMMSDRAMTVPPRPRVRSRP
jgi:hypothetical protein